MSNLLKNQLHSLQWLLFMLANSIAIPIAIAPLIDLNDYETALLIQRVFLISSFFTIVQIFIGHRLTINEGCGSMWFGLFSVLGTMAPILNFTKVQLLTSLSLAVLFGGLMTFILGVFGLVGKIIQFFTPSITGAFSILLALQLGGAFIKNMLGITSETLNIQPLTAFISIIIVTIVVGITIYCKGIFKTLGLLCGIIIGWLIYLFLGMLETTNVVSDHDRISIAPLINFQWEPSIYLTGIITGILVLSNSITAIISMSKLNNSQLKGQQFNASSVVTGLADIMGGIFTTPGYSPFMGASGFVSFTNDTSKLPLILASLMMFAMGIFSPITNFVATLPPSVASAALFGTISQMLVIGIKDMSLLKWENREVFIVGISVIMGVGVFTLPSDTFSALPVFLIVILSNGMMVGLLLAILLEHVLLPKNKNKTLKSDKTTNN